MAYNEHPKNSTQHTTTTTRRITATAAMASEQQLLPSFPSYENYLTYQRHLRASGYQPPYGDSYDDFVSHQHEAQAQRQLSQAQSQRQHPPQAHEAQYAQYAEDQLANRHQYATSQAQYSSAYDQQYVQSPQSMDRLPPARPAPSSAYNQLYAQAPAPAPETTVRQTSSSHQQQHTGPRMYRGLFGNEYIPSAGEEPGINPFVGEEKEAYILRAQGFGRAVNRDWANAAGIWERYEGSTRRAQQQVASGEGVWRGGQGDDLMPYPGESKRDYVVRMYRDYPDMNTQSGSESRWEWWMHGL